MFALLLNVICLAISFGFPVISTYKAIKTKNDQLLRPLSIYWLIYAALSGLENFFYSVLSFIPFYPLIKLYICLWLILPGTKGAQYLYFTHVEPFIEKHEAGLENLLQNFSVWDYLKYFSGDRSNATSSSTLTNQPQPVASGASLFDGLMKNVFNDDLHQRLNPVSFRESLVGVFQALPLQNQALDSTKEESDTLEKVASDDKETLSADTSNPTFNEYDVVGKEEYENFGKDLKNSTAQPVTSIPSNTWFYGWFSSSKVKEN